MIYKNKGGVSPGSGKTQCSSIGQNQNREVEGVDGRTGGGKGAYVTFGEWVARKGEITLNVNKKYI